MQTAVAENPTIAGTLDEQLSVRLLYQRIIVLGTEVDGTLDEQLSVRLLYQRIIVLGTEVDDRVANRLCAQLLLLSAEDSRSDISLYINSPGGSVSAGLAIYA